MRPEPRAEGRRWLDQALRDLDDARFTAGGGRHNLACFLCQQAAEKALKGFLYLKGEENVLGHSVGDLCRRAGAFAPGFETLRSDAAKLDLFYIPTRYPNGLPGGLPAEAFDAGDAQRALEMATRLIDCVREVFE